MEDRLSDGNGEGAAEVLADHDAADGDGEISFWEAFLDCEDRLSIA